MVDNLFCTANKKISTVYKTLLELAKHLVLRLFREIDQHISAHDQMAPGRVRIFQKVMFFKLHSRLDLF